MQRWVRPYGTRYDGDLAATAIGIAAVGVLVVTCGFALQGPAPVTSWIAILAFDALFLTMAWRIARVGLFIHEHGVMVRTVLRTRVVPWTAIALVREGRPRRYNARAIVLELRGGQRAVETPIWLRTGSPNHRNRIKLSADEFQSLIERLNTMVGRLS